MDLKNIGIFFYVALAVCLAVTAAFLTRGVAPQIMTWNRLQNELRRRDTELKQRYNIARERDELNREISAIEQKYGNMNEMFFSLDNISGAIKEIARISEALGIEFVSLVPSATAKLETSSSATGFSFYQTPIAIRMKTGYAKLIDFIRRIENSGKLIKIDRFQVKKNPSDLLIHEVDMTLSIYSLEKQGSP